MIADYVDIKQYQVETVEEDVELLLDELSSAYKQTIGEIILNYADTVIPVYEAEADLLGYFNVNDDCDTSCAATCFNPSSLDFLYMDSDCMTTCGCAFTISTKNETEVWAAIKAWENSQIEFEEEVEIISSDFEETGLEPTITRFSDFV